MADDTASVFKTLIGNAAILPQDGTSPRWKPDGLELEPATTSKLLRPRKEGKRCTLIVNSNNADTNIQEEAAH